MNSSSLLTNILRIIIVFLAQVMIFKYVSLSLGNFAYLHFLIYPIAFLLLPIRSPLALTLIIAFVVGFGVDIFYDSLGVHASASVFSVYFRSLVIAFLEPFEGYNTDDSPVIKRLGFSWFVSFISITMLAHLFFYFSVEAFSFVFFFDIFLNTIFSFIVSLLVIIISQLIFRTKY
jgi:hypothetical protein